MDGAVVLPYQIPYLRRLGGAGGRDDGWSGPPVIEGDLRSLTRAAQHGDEDAFRSLYRAVQPGLLRYLRALVGDDAEDVASEAWYQISRDLCRFDGKGEFKAWALTIARHRALDHLRRQRRRPAVPMPPEHLPQITDERDAGERAAELMSTDAAISLIASLPRDQAEAVLLRAVVGLDATTAARVLKKRPGAVRMATFRGLRRLAERLDELGIEPVAPETEGDPIRHIQQRD
jgi:RNA polymerase sigma-70 factor (ECF subfamily)